MSLILGYQGRLNAVRQVQVQLTDQYKAVMAAMTVTKPSATDQIFQNAWLKGLIDLGVLSKGIVINNYACQDSQSSLLNWVSPGTFNPSLVSTPAFTAYKGFKGSAGKDINLNFTPSTNGAGFLGKDDITVLIGVNEEIVDDNPDFGSISSAQSIQIWSKTTGLVSVRLNTGTSDSTIRSAYSKRYFALSRNNATQINIFKNLSKKTISTAAAASSALTDSPLYACGRSASSISNKTLSFAMVFKYLTDSEIQGIMKICDAYLKNYGNNIRPFQTNTDFNVITEGHSFMAQYMADACEGVVNTVTSWESAVAGDTISQMNARGTTIDGKLITETSNYKNVLVIWIGVNDFVNTVGAGTTAYNALKTYVQARIAAGHNKIFVYTMTPTTYGGRNATFEAERVIFNNLLRNDLVLLSGVYILDTDTKTELTDCNNAAYFNAADKLHLVVAGAMVAGTLFSAKMVQLFG